ncbi:hypothetical protein AVEN_188031-1 [Araneus ventricosus]|uniref:Uncharacterized protein n=1 Tax=Araneus ventricosus TaxID=182803 RepID=A0A4Y2LQG3_ARAVE|nr:hypothetical protein AVEN_33781-1 [Araneus ventricosus]GBN16778.1 hypothetical protein AVEN_188031-1 [Araneus ventricosus]
MESSLSLQKFQADDPQGWATNCQQRNELLFSRKIHSVARNCLSPVSVEWGGLRRLRAHRVNELRLHSTVQAGALQCRYHLLYNEIVVVP